MKRWNVFWAAVAIIALVLSEAATLSAAKGRTVDLDDRDITIAVETDLMLEEAVPSHNIDVSTDRGIVTLSGSVDSYYAKLRAKETAESVKGVLRVVNSINVQSLARPDSRIRGDIVSALVADPVTESSEINVTVVHGAATLFGKVDSPTEKRAAEEIVETVAGVIDVRNLLNYDLAGDRTDADIKQDIKYRLRSDAAIASGLISVSVDDGRVSLDGTAGSAAEKTEATREAWAVPGVASVDNRIDVIWLPDDRRSDWDGGWSDEDMWQAIEKGLHSNPRVSSYNVVTTVADGVATLSGTVDNLQAKRAAEKEARDVLGIWRVKNYVRVRPAVDRTDFEITADVRDALRRNVYVDRYDILATVFNGKVRLTGEVDSWFMKHQAAKAAASAAGVVDIQNDLDVDQKFAAKPDGEIEDDIESQLFWSPFVDSKDIGVEVHGGVATLTGHVEDWGEWRAARENALEGGATSVICKLTFENRWGTG